MRKVLPKPGEGPSESSMQNGRLVLTNITVLAESSKPEDDSIYIKTVITGSGDPGYLLTSSMFPFLHHPFLEPLRFSLSVSTSNNFRVSAFHPPSAYITSPFDCYLNNWRQHCESPAARKERWGTDPHDRVWRCID